jgi:hypothetical protein
MVFFDQNFGMAWGSGLFYKRCLNCDGSGWLKASSVGTEAGHSCQTVDARTDTAPLSGGRGPFGRVEKAIHPKGGNVPEFRFLFPPLSNSFSATIERLNELRTSGWAFAVQHNVLTLRQFVVSGVRVRCCIPVRKAALRLKETKDGTSSTRYRIVSAGPNST